MPRRRGSRVPDEPGATLDQLVGYCLAFDPADPQISVEVERLPNEVVLRMTHAAYPDRHARVSASTTSWIDLSIDGGFGLWSADDQAPAHEWGEYIADYAALGARYLVNGAEERFSKTLGIPMRVLDADRGWRGIAQLSVGQQARYLWRRLWRRR